MVPVSLPVIVPASEPEPLNTKRLVPEPVTMSPALVNVSEWSVGRAVSLTCTVPVELIVNVRSRVQAEKSSVS